MLETTHVRGYLRRLAIQEFDKALRPDIFKTVTEKLQSDKAKQVSLSLRAAEFDKPFTTI